MRSRGDRPPGNTAASHSTSNQEEAVNRTSYRKLAEVSFYSALLLKGAFQTSRHLLEG